MSAAASAVRRAPTSAWRTRATAITATLAVTETISWGVLHYAFAVFLLPLQDALDASQTAVAGAFTLAVLVSGVVGLWVGRHLDDHGPRAVMTLGSAAGAALVVAWSQVTTLVELYAVFALLGVVMAAVLYEPAFVVLAKWHPEPLARRRAMTAMTLVAAFASFIFLPLSHALVDAHGWRDALLVLAGIVAVTVPLHGAVLRAAPTPPRTVDDRPRASTGVFRSRSFWLLSGAYVLASVAAVAVMVLAIPVLIDRGFSSSFAAFAVGIIGISQIPGRLAFAPIARRCSPALSTGTVFGAITVGIALLAVARTEPLALVAFVLLGMGNGMATLARATTLADRYGTAGYGQIASVAAALTTTARALAPVLAAALAAATSYDVLLATLGALAIGATAAAVLSELGSSSSS